MHPSRSENRPNAARFSIVLVTYYSTKGAYSCLRSFGQCAREFSNQEWIIVDNSCNTEELKRLKQTVGSGIDVVAPSSNLGFAGGVNLGVSHATNQWLLLINPDVELSKEGVSDLFNEVDCADPSALAFAGGLTDRNHRVWCGIRFRWGVWFEDRRAGSKAKLVGPSGGFAIFDRSTFLSLGGFDERLFAWGEDADLAVRLFRIGVQTKELSVCLPHSGGHSVLDRAVARKRAYSLAKNRVLVARRHFGGFQKAWFIIVWCFLFLPRLFNLLRRGTAFADIAGFVDGWLGSSVCGTSYAWRPS